MSATAPLNVLVVDPDVQTRGRLTTFLSGEGFQPTELSEPGAAPAAVREGEYQMVLLDVSGRGVDVLQQIRSFDDDLCVICMTGEPDVATAVATMKHRAFDFLAKPCRPDSLRPVLRAAIREHGLLVDEEARLNACVGERIRGRRHEIGLTLKQVARRTGLSVSLISQIELGKSAASISTLYKVAAALGVRMTFFFETI